MSTLQPRRDRLGVTADINNSSTTISAVLIGSLLAIRVSVRSGDPGYDCLSMSWIFISGMLKQFVH